MSIYLSYPMKMISKKVLKIDLTGQFLIVLMTLLYTMLRPALFLIALLVSMFLLGVWQFINALIQAIAYHNKKRKNYLIVVVFYIAFFVIVALIKGGFYEDENWVKTLTGIYIFGGSLGLAIWYFYNTYRDLLYSEHPRSFWDYEF